MRKTRPFTLMETVVAIVILLIIMDIVFDFFVGARKNSRKNDDALAMALAFESTVKQLNPKKYSLNDLKEVLRKEAEANSFSKREISWKLLQKDGKIDIRFFSKGKQIFETELLLP